VSSVRFCLSALTGTTSTAKRPSRQGRFCLYKQLPECAKDIVSYGTEIDKRLSIMMLAQQGRALGKDVAYRSEEFGTNHPMVLTDWVKMAIRHIAHQPREV
jgi:hypothetical protein